MPVGPVRMKDGLSIPLPSYAAFNIYAKQVKCRRSDVVDKLYERKLLTTSRRAVMADEKVQKGADTTLSAGPSAKPR